MKKLFSKATAVLMVVVMCLAMGTVASAAEKDSGSMAPRQVSQSWSNLTLGSDYVTLSTGNNGKIDNWYGSYATVTFSNKNTSDYISIKVIDYDSNGNVQSTKTSTVYGSGGSAQFKVTPGAYYVVQARKGNVSSGINLSTYTDR